MSFLIDTCCISELIKKKPNEQVLSWFSQHNEKEMFLSVITFGELEKGVHKLPTSKKREELSIWINQDLSKRFSHRILDISFEIAKTWGRVLALAELNGTPVPAIDALIAATAFSHNLSVVTRNVKDMSPTGIDIINPWEFQE